MMKPRVPQNDFCTARSRSVWLGKSWGLVLTWNLENPRGRGRNWGLVYKKEGQDERSWLAVLPISIPV